MSIWTLICIIIIISVSGDALRKVFQGLQIKKSNELTAKKINDLLRRIDELENQSGIHGIERRLQALEAIVVDDEYILKNKFKKAFG